jgi:hypothetical protein
VLYFIQLSKAYSSANSYCQYYETLILFLKVALELQFQQSEQITM